jgi:hypothetical protein
MEFINLNIQPTMLPFTVLLLLSALYWVFTIIGGVDVCEVDVDLNLDADDAFSWAKLFGFADVPVMLVLSFWAVSMWFGSLVGYLFFTQSFGLMFLIMQFANLVVSFFVVKVISKPFVWFFRSLNKNVDDKEIPVIGLLCVSNSEVNDLGYKEGRVKRNGAPLLLNVMTREGVIAAKQTLIVVEKKENHNVYIVEEFNDWKE